MGIKDVKKNSSKTKNIVLIIIFVTLIAIITFIALYTINKRNNSSEVQSATDSSLLLPSGPLKYELVSTIKIAGGARFVYFTPETTDKRLIALNDKVVKELKKSGKINNKMNTYFIDYFSDKTVAKTYYSEMGSAKLSKIRKISLITKYTASMSFSKATNINHLIKISDAKIIKKY